MDIGTRLRRLRKARDLTVKELSDLSGVAEKTIYRIEVGEVADPKISSIEPLVRALQCSADELLFDEPVIDKALERSLRELQRLPDDEKKPLLLVLDRYRLGSDLVRDFQERGYVYKEEASPDHGQKANPPTDPEKSP